MDVERIVGTNRALGHRPSILQDLEAGRPMEIDALYTVPLEMARHARRADARRSICSSSLIKVKAREAGLYSG